MRLTCAKVRWNVYVLRHGVEPPGGLMQHCRGREQRTVKWIRLPGQVNKITSEYYCYMNMNI